MSKIDNIADEKTTTVSDTEQFRDERLEAYPTDEWPSRIDRAALDVLYDVAIGSSDGYGDFGGTIGADNFGSATGTHYASGLVELAAGHSDLPGLLDRFEREHGAAAVGDLAFRLNQLRYELRTKLVDEGSLSNLDRAVEALLEKIAMGAKADVSARQPLNRPESVTDAMVQLFSDPAVTDYADRLSETVDDLSAAESLLASLDAPEMTTPLWDHQRDALAAWLEHDCQGYVDMATATGKTVLGLAAVAVLYGRVHPTDEAELFADAAAGPRSTEDDSHPAVPVEVDRTDASVLVVAGNELILEQWQSEFDEHLNIPRERTATEDRTMAFSWGTIEFRTAQDLFGLDDPGEYDLVVLDEAHQYRRGKGGTGWRRVLDELAGASEAIIAMSGSIDTSWQGDDAAKRALEGTLPELATFSVAEARAAGVIADFEWEVYYAHAADGDAQKGVIDSTVAIAEAYDLDTHKIRIDELEGLPEDAPTAFETLGDLRAFAQSNAGADVRQASAAFDDLATDAFTRRPKRWQLHPPVETVVDLVDRHAPDQQTLVLVGSYDQAERIGDELKDRYGEDLVIVPNSDAPDQFAEISAFKGRDGGVIVGPADVLGMGVDLPATEVAINLSKGGVSASLVQRIGRVLRDPDGEKEATFYQVVTLPSDPNAILSGEDGRRLLRRASEFRALGARLRQLPGYDVEEAAMGTLATLEEAGADAITGDDRPIEAIVEDEVARAFLEKLHRSITVASAHGGDRKPFLQTFDGGEMDRQKQPVAEAVEHHGASPEKHDDAGGGMAQPEAGGAMNTRTIDVEVSPALNRLLEGELEGEEYASMDALVDDIVGNHIATQINDPEVTLDVGQRTFDVTVPTHLAAVIEAELGEDSDETVTDFVAAAVRERLDLQTEPVTLSVEMSGGLSQIVDTVTEKAAAYDSAETLVEEALAVRFG